MSNEKAVRNCKKKRIFYSLREAQNFPSTGVEPYQCNVCGFWHLTSTIAGKLNKIRQDISFRDAMEWVNRKNKRRR